MAIHCEHTKPQQLPKLAPSKIISPVFSFHSNLPTLGLISKRKIFAS